MLLKLAALGALGYAGYKYYENTRNSPRSKIPERTQAALAGGPLSSEARVQSSPDMSAGG